MAKLTSTDIYGSLYVQGEQTSGNITAPKLKLTQATGIAPLDITSTTKVVNLNADLLDDAHLETIVTNSDIKIPSSKALITYVASVIPSVFSISASSDVLKATGGNNSTSYGAETSRTLGKFYRHADIPNGTTALKYDGYLYGTKLFSDNKEVLTSYTDTKNTAGSTNDAAKLFIIGAKDQSANPQTFSNSLVYTTAGDMYAKKFVDSDSTGYYLDPANTTTSLNVAGDIIVADTKKLQLYGASNYLTYNTWETTSSSMDIKMTSTDGSIKLWTNSAERMRINKDGNVGIGTDTPKSKLHVAGIGNTAGGNIQIGPLGVNTAKWSYITGAHYNTTTEPEGFALIGGYSDATENKVVIGGSIYEINPATKIEFWTHNATTHAQGGTLKMILDNIGNLGIGTNTPTSKLDVSGSIKASGNIDLTQGTNRQIFMGSSSNWGYVLSSTGDDFSIKSGDIVNASMYIKYAGGANNVGIGTNSPSEKFDVAGNTKTRDLILSDTSDVAKATMRYDSTSKSIKFVFA